MGLVVLFLVLLLSGCAGGSGIAPISGASPSLHNPQPTKTYAFMNGRWFDGKGFEAATWYSVQGRLTRTPPHGPVDMVDLSGLFIVPPFGEAHNHNVEGSWNLQAVSARYLRDGVFYVKIPNNVREFGVQIRVCSMCR